MGARFRLVQQVNWFVCKSTREHYAMQCVSGREDAYASLFREDVVWGKPLLVSRPHLVEEDLQVLGVELCVEERGYHAGLLYPSS